MNSSFDCSGSRNSLIEFQNQFSISTLTEISEILPNTNVKQIENDVDSYISEEFRELFHKIKNLNYFEEYNSKHLNDRKIITGNNAGYNQVFIKKSACESKQSSPKQEEIAFLVSHRLNLNVVPPTMACGGNKNILDNLSATVKSQLSNEIDDSYQGVVVQEGVELHSNQFHMIGHNLTSFDKFRRNILRGLENFDIPLAEERAKEAVLLQSKRLISEFALDVNNICQALFFNIVAGRRDAGKRNSVIDKFSNIKEIDNEAIGFEKTSSWLFEVFADCILTRESIDNILRAEESIFKDLECADIAKNTNENFTKNLFKLKSFLFDKKDSVVKIDDLKIDFYNSGIIDF